MFKIIKASDGTVLALTEDVTYIKKADNGCYILCPEPDASGISYAGTPYHLFGRKPLDDAESVILEPTDIGGWIMGAKAAIEDADEMNVDQAYRLTLLELNGSSWWMPCTLTPPPQSRPRPMHRRQHSRLPPVQAMQTRALRKLLTACRS